MPALITWTSVICGLHWTESIAGERDAIIVLSEGFERQGQRHPDADLIEVTSGYLTHDPDPLGEVHIAEGIWDLECRGRLSDNGVGVEDSPSREPDGLQ